MWSYSHTPCDQTHPVIAHHVIAVCECWVNTLQHREAILFKFLPYRTQPATTNAPPAQWVRWLPVKAAQSARHARKERSLSTLLPSVVNLVPKDSLLSKARRAARCIQGRMVTCVRIVTYVQWSRVCVHMRMITCVCMVTYV